MGLLAGAAAGLGGEMVEISRRTQENKAKAEAATIDHQREMALQRLRDKAAMARQQSSDKAAGERSAASDVAAGERTAATVAGAEARTAAEIEGRKEVEQMGIDAGKYAKSGSGGAQDPRLKALVDRYAFESEVSTGIDPNTSMPTTTERIKITDKVGGRVYSQEGDILRYANDKETPRYPANRDAAERKLLQNPELADRFYKDYHYLPIDYARVIREHQLAAEGFGALGTPQE